MSLLDNLQKASFKGVEFLVKNSSISFGQKTITHQYPNSGRTEVEFLGQAEDVFSLDIYIHSVDSDYIQKRNSLKNTLNSEGSGILIHPYDGRIQCSVVDKVTLTENDTKLGIASFSVTFQKMSSYLYPVASLNNLSKINNLFSQLKESYKNIISGNFNFVSFLPDSFKATIGTLQSLNQNFENIKTLVSLSKKLESVYDYGLEQFAENIVASSSDGQTLADNLDNVISNLDNLADDPIDSITLYASLYLFGGQQVIKPELSVESKIINSNYRLISNYINIIALGLSYNSIILVNFETDIELKFYEQKLEAQYKFVAPNMPSEIISQINVLRSEITKFFEAQEVRRVIEKETPANHLAQICYQLYGTTEDYKKLYNLNNNISPVIYEGNIKVLTND